MYKHYTEQAREIGTELGGAVGRTFTPRELWLVVKLAKLARRSCRHNTAFNSAMSAAFPYATFRQVQKTDGTGRTYPGLEISVNGETAGANGDAEEDGGE